MSDKSELVQRAEQVLLDMLNKASEIGSAAVDEIPLVVQELLTWKFAESLLLFICGIVFTIAWVALSVKIWKSGSEPRNEYGGIKRDIWDMTWFAYAMLNLFGVVISLPWIFCNIDWLKIWLAPRVYLLEYAATLMK